MGQTEQRMEMLNKPDFYGNKPDFGTIFRESQELYTKVLGFGALAVVIYLIAAGVVGLSFEAATGMNQLSNQLAEDMKDSSDLNVIWEKAMAFYSENMTLTLATRFGTELVMLLSFPLAGGFLLVCRQMDKNGYTSVSTLFEGFKPFYWSRLMVLALVYFVLSKVGLMLFLIPGIYIWVAAVLACPFVIFGGKSGIDALRSSVQLVNLHWFAFFKILLVASVIGLLGYLIFCVGRIVTYPFVLVSIYVLYKQTVGFEEDAISDIGKN